MILKSLGHKTRSFGKLLAYVARGAEQDGAAMERTAQNDADENIIKPAVFSRNLMVDPTELSAVEQTFEANAQFLRPRQGGNWCYHEIIALPKTVKEKDKASVEAMLFELAGQYVKGRAPRQLVWGQVHWETKHPHLHLVISANEVRSPRRVRLPKARFTQLVEELEAFKCARWPEVLPEKLWQHRKRYNQKRRSHAEDHLTRRTGRASKRAELAETLSEIFTRARWIDDVRLALADQGLALYRRGRTWGVLEQVSGKRYRLSRLGLSSAFEAMVQRMQILEHRMDQLAERRITGTEHATGRERITKPYNPSRL